DELELEDGDIEDEGGNSPSFELAFKNALEDDPYEFEEGSDRVTKEHIASLFGEDGEEEGEQDEEEEDEGADDEEPEPDPDEKPGDDADSVRRAEEAGFDAKTIESLRKAGLLEKVVSKLPAGEPEEETPEPDADEDPEEEAPRLNEEYLDESAVKYMRWQDERRQQLQSQVGMLAQHVLQEQTERAFQSMGEEYRAIFGEGDSDEVTPEQLKNRQDALKEVQVLANGMVQAKQQVPKLKTVLKKAAESLFGPKLRDQTKKGERERIAETLQKRKASAGIPSS